MKKILFLVLILATFITIFCLSSSAVDYGQQFLDPDYYDDDIALVFGLYYDSDLTGYPGAPGYNSNSNIFIPLLQIRIPDYSGGNFTANIVVSNWNSDYNDANQEVVIDFLLFEGSYAAASTVVDLSDFEFYNLSDYSIQSDMWDDPCFFKIDNMGYYSTYISETDEFTLLGSNTMFFGLECNSFYDSIPLPNPATLEIPTYPARPIVPDPDPDIPLTPGAINNFLVNTLAAPIGIFSHIFEATGTTYAVVGCFMFFMFVKFVVHPVIGSGLGSDKVKRSKPKGDSDG